MSCLQHPSPPSTDSQEDRRMDALCPPLLLILYFISLFIYLFKIFNICLFLRDRARAGEGWREKVGGGGTQNPKQAPGSELSAQSSTWGWNSWTTRS